MTPDKTVRSEVRYYALGTLATLATAGVAGPLFMYLMMPSTGDIDPRTGDMVIDPQPDVTAVWVVVLVCIILYGFVQFIRHRPGLRLFRCVRALGLAWAVTLLPLAFLGVCEVVCPPHIGGPFSSSQFELIGLALFAPVLCLEFLLVAVFYLCGGGKPSPLARRIDPALAEKICNKTLRKGK